MSNLLSTNCSSIIVLVYRPKHRADMLQYITPYMKQATYYKQRSQTIPFLIAGHITETIDNKYCDYNIPVLVRLLYMQYSTPWYLYASFFVQRESLENVNTSLRILTALAEDCPEETLLRSVKRNWVHDINTCTCIVCFRWKPYWKVHLDVHVNFWRKILWTFMRTHTCNHAVMFLWVKQCYFWCTSYAYCSFVSTLEWSRKLRALSVHSCLHYWNVCTCVSASGSPHCFTTTS